MELDHKDKASYKKAAKASLITSKGTAAQEPCAPCKKSGLTCTFWELASGHEGGVLKCNHCWARALPCAGGTPAVKCTGPDASTE